MTCWEMIDVLPGYLFRAVQLFFSSILTWNMLHDVLFAFGTALLSNAISRKNRNDRNRFLPFALRYLGIIVIAALFYSFIRYVYNIRITPSVTFLSVLKDMLKGRSLVLLLIVPFFVGLINFENSANTGRRAALGIVAALVMLSSPFLPYNRKSGGKQIVTDSFYTKQFYDIRQFGENAQTQYGRLPSPTDVTQGYMEEPTEPVYLMDFDRAVEATRIFYSTGKHENARACLDRAYELFLAYGGTDSFHIGSMWWYKGYYEENAQFYYDAGIVFELDRDYQNAAIGFAPAWRGGIADAGERALLNYLYTVREGKAQSDAVDFLLEAVNRSGARTPYLSEYAALLPEDLRVQVAFLTTRAPELGAEELAVIDRLWDAYPDCPKLALLRACHDTQEKWFYYNPGRSLYNAWQEHPQYFEPEDRINTAWLLYLAGDYRRADELVAAYDYPEAQMVKAALYLADSRQASPAQAQDLQYILSYHEGTFLERYDDKSVLTYELIKAYLTKAVGSGAGPRSQLAAGQYDACISLCDSLMANGEVRPEILLLKADALMGKAATTGQADCYQLAEETLLELKKKTKGEYADCLERLREVYISVPGRETELRDTDAVLRALS